MIIKQSTLLKWMRPEPSPKKNENREEQITKEVSLQTASGLQTVGTSSLNSSIKTTRPEPYLLVPGLA